MLKRSKKDLGKQELLSRKLRGPDWKDKRKKRQSANEEDCWLKRKLGWRPNDKEMKRPRDREGSRSPRRRQLEMLNWKDSGTSLELQLRN